MRKKKEQATIPTSGLTKERQKQLLHEIFYIRKKQREIEDKCMQRRNICTTDERYALAYMRLQIARSIRGIELAGLPMPDNFKPAPWKPAK